MSGAFVAAVGCAADVQKILAEICIAGASPARDATENAPSVSIETYADTIVVTRSGFGGRAAYVRVLPEVALASTSFAWMVAASRALGASLTLDADALATRAFYMHTPQLETTMMREIASVPPGTRMEIAPHRSTRSLLAPPPAQRASADPAAGLRARLALAVERATRGCDRVAVMTGGGLDSSALLAMTHARGITTNAFALDFAGAGNDQPHLVALARSLNLAPDRLAPSDVVLPQSLTADGLPLCWPSASAEAMLLSRARAWGADRVLCGVNADALFDVDAETWAGGAKRIARCLMLRFLPPAARSMARRARGAWQRPSPFEGARVRRLRQAGLDSFAWPNDPLDTADDRIRAAFRSPHLADAAELRSQEESLAGMARTDPYLDADLVTFALSIPPNVLLDNGSSRGLFREALRDVLPDSVRLRPDKASFAPLHAALFRSPTVDSLLPFRTFEALGDLQIVDAPATRRAMAKAVTDGAFAETVAADLYPLLAAESFARQHAR